MNFFYNHVSLINFFLTKVTVGRAPKKQKQIKNNTSHDLFFGVFNCFGKLSHIAVMTDSNPPNFYYNYLRKIKLN
jgi:hypothetical protein